MGPRHVHFHLGGAVPYTGYPAVVVSSLRYSLLVLSTDYFVPIRGARPVLPPPFSRPCQFIPVAQVCDPLDPPNTISSISRWCVPLRRPTNNLPRLILLPEAPTTHFCQRVLYKRSPPPHIPNCANPKTRPQTQQPLAEQSYKSPDPTHVDLHRQQPRLRQTMIP